VLRSLRQLARRSRFRHSEVATTHRGRDKPGRIRRHSDSTRLGRRRRRRNVVYVHVVVGAIDHGDRGDHCLQPIGGLHLAPEEKPVALFHKEESGRCCLFLAVLEATSRPIDCSVFPRSSLYRSFKFMMFFLNKVLSLKSKSESSLYESFDSSGLLLLLHS
jgi:hypothetical protein